ncbi:MAG: hypothetical protein LBE22_12045 [Azoarcus sp.]|jgi:hypothetical protein|nr:hypothetical protein [Azoarcus sp.]
MKAAVSSAVYGIQNLLKPSGPEFKAASCMARFMASLSPPGTLRTCRLLEPGKAWVDAENPLVGRYLGEIAWETEVWVADAPSHLIHFDGERFLGPYNAPWPDQSLEVHLA